MRSRRAIDRATRRRNCVIALARLILQLANANLSVVRTLLFFLITRTSSVLLCAARKFSSKSRDNRDRERKRDVASSTCLGRNIVVPPRRLRPSPADRRRGARRIQRIPAVEKNSRGRGASVPTEIDARSVV